MKLNFYVFFKHLSFKGENIEFVNDDCIYFIFFVCWSWVSYLLFFGLKNINSENKIKNTLMNMNYLVKKWLNHAAFYDFILTYFFIDIAYLVFNNLFTNFLLIHCCLKV